MRKFVLLAAPLVIVTACSGGADDGVEPGEWALTMEVTDISAPGAPDGAPTPPPQTQVLCISPEEAANMDGGILAPTSNENCTGIDATMSGGTLEFEATCAVPGGGPMQMTMNGTYDRESITADVEMVMAETPMGAVTMTATMTGEHQGECSS